MDQTSSLVPPPVDAYPGAFHVWTRRFVCISLALVGTWVICVYGRELVKQLVLLSDELADARDREPVGYVGISSEQPEFMPSSCIREADGRRYLWAGSGVKGQAGWFDVSATNLPLREFVFAFGRDRIRTIDYPILQNPNDEIARRIYPERPVLGIVVRGEARAYPLTVMEKVEVVNDKFGEKLLAVTYLPLKKEFAAYDRNLDGRPVSLGSSGYCYRDAFVLYDRDTDSLWYPAKEGLTAITGPLTGKVLKPAAESIERASWGNWQRRNPNTLVVVGADRSRGIPFPSSDEVASRSL